MITKLILLPLLFLTLFASPLKGQDSLTKIFVCEHSLETLDWAEKLIGVAEQSIEMAAPFLGGEVGCRLLEKMAERLEEKELLQIYLLVHPVFLAEKEKGLITFLVNTYPQRFHLAETAEVVSSHSDLTSVNNHMKLLLVDERYFIVGGTNFDDYLCAEGTYTPRRLSPKSADPFLELPSGGRDSDVIGSGDLAQALRITYHKLFALWETFQLTKRFNCDPERFTKKSHYFILGPVIANLQEFEESKRAIFCRNVEMIFSGPMHHPNRIAERYASLIRGAHKNIVMGHLYFNPTKEIFEALMGAVKRGVATTYIGNGVYAGVSPKYNGLFTWASRMNYLPLFYGRTFSYYEEKKISLLPIKKTKIYEYCVPDILYHKKTMVLDERILVIGSYNLGLKSAIGDYELVLVIDSPEVAQAQLKVFARDQQYSQEVTVKQAREWYFDPWTFSIGGLQKQFHGFM